jgi:histone H3/H4
MVTLDPAENEQHARLRAALWKVVGRKTDDGATTTERSKASARFLGSLSELLYEKINSTASDLEAFARNADRNVIHAQDVVLLGRHNDVLKSVLQERAREVDEQLPSARE